MIIVSNTSPIINLAAIGQIKLLKKLYSKVLIPQAVFHEIAIAGKGQPGSNEVNTLDWIENKKVNNLILVKALRHELDIGEAEAIAMAIEKKADLLLLDERLARKVASRFDVQFIGVLGIIVQAKRKGHILQVKPLIDKLIIDAGFWINPKLYNHVVTTAGEDCS